MKWYKINSHRYIFLKLLATIIPNNSEAIKLILPFQKKTLNLVLNAPCLNYLKPCHSESLGKSTLVKPLSVSLLYSRVRLLCWPAASPAPGHYCCTTLHSTALKYSALYCIMYSALHYTTLHWNTLKYSAPHYSALHYHVLHFFALIHSPLQCNALVYKLYCLWHDHSNLGYCKFLSGP